MPFQFAYRLDQSESDVPIAIGTWPVTGTGAYNVGDLLTIDSSGNLGTVTTSVGTVTAVMAGTRASGTAGQPMAVYLVHPNQVWSCVMDSATCTLAVGTRVLTVTNAGTLSASATSGSICLFDKSQVDASGNVLAFVTFPFTTF